MSRLGQEPRMAGERTRPETPLHRLRARWLEPSPPLAVDDEPFWTPPPDPAGEPTDEDAEAELPAAAPANP
jgi:hypothetical protein